MFFRVRNRKCTLCNYLCLSVFSRNAVSSSSLLQVSFQISLPMMQYDIVQGMVEWIGMVL